MSAHYTASNGAVLEKEAIIDALRVVVEKHSALSHVFVQRPSPNKGKHELHTGVLPAIDLEQCIEYLDDGQNGLTITSKDLERAHNQWLWGADEPERPLWKLFVKGHSLCFVYHHSLGDGKAGMVFHQEFLAALNCRSPPNGSRSKDAPPAIVHPRADAPLTHEPEDAWEGKVSIVEMLWAQFIWWLLRLWYGSSQIHGDLPPLRPHLKSRTAVAEPSQRTVTRISSHRIPAEQMSRIIDACRARQTTFTPLLITMLTVVLATEFYPEARFGATRWNFDLRPMLPMSRIGGGTENGTFVNASGSWTCWHRLGPFQRVVTKGKGKEIRSLNIEAVWDLVRSYKEEMTSALSGKAIRNWIAVKHLGTDLEDVVQNAFPSSTGSFKPTFSVSNIGVFPGGGTKTEKRTIGPWAIDDAQFSAGAMNGPQGTRGAVFHVAGVQGGDSVINATFAEGMMPREMVEKILERAVARILEIV